MCFREYTLAAEELNDRGMKKFKEGVEALKRKRAVLKEHWQEGGDTTVVEIMKSSLSEAEGSHAIDREGFVVDDEMGLNSVQPTSNPSGKYFWNFDFKHM